LNINLPTKISLLAGPTPLEPLKRIGAITGHPNIFVKRDDVMPLGMAGNKVRSLEFWMAEALQQGADTVLVAGQCVSNQCRLTAAAAAKIGLNCVILHNDAQPARIEGNLLLSTLFGAEIIFLGPVSEQERADKVTQKADDLQKQGKKPYIIGDPVLGAMGYVVAAQELLLQTPKEIGSFDCIVIPGSMGPTEAGLLYGLIASGYPGQVYVISVEYQKQEMQQRIEHIFNRLEQKLGKTLQNPDSIAIFDDRFLGNGYGIASAASNAATQVFATTEALLLEPTYTAKPFAALLAMVADQTIKPTESVCILHTGGTPSLFANR